MTVPRRSAAIASFAAALVGLELMRRGVWDAQPLVTFGELPREDEVERARTLLLVAAVCSLAAAALLAAARRPWHALLVALPGPLTLLLVETTPSNRGAGYLGVLLGLLVLGVVVHAGRGEDPGGRQAAVTDHG